MTGVPAAAIAAMVFVPMIVEARRAASNERTLLAGGGIEPAGDVYRAMQIVYPAAFLAMIAEGAWRGGEASGGLTVAGAAVFTVAKLLKWWAVATLGPRWTFRVVVVPDAPRIVTGPYRFVRHPNYVGVVGELVGVLLLTGAFVIGLVSLVIFGALLARRISVEERALGAILARKRDDAPASTVR